MATNESTASKVGSSDFRQLDEWRKSAVPPNRQPGVYRRKRIIFSHEDWEGALECLKTSMGEYRVLGFDVECINPRYYQQYQRADGDEPTNFRRVQETAAINGAPPRAHRQNARNGILALLLPSTDDFSNGTESSPLPPRLQKKKSKSTLPYAVLPTPPATKRRKEVSVLIQLATWPGVVVMLRLCYWHAIPDLLRGFLADPSYIKVGVGIDQDAARLLEDWGLVVRGWIDLRHLCIDLCVQCNDHFFLRQMGLKSLAESLFGEVINTTMPMGIKKMRSIACSDWNAAHLKEDQVRYAAWDAQIGVDIFSLVTQRLYKLGSPLCADRSYYETLFLKCTPFLDVPPSRHPRRVGDEYEEDEEDEYDSNTSKEDGLLGEEEELRDLYNSCRIQAELNGNRGFLAATQSVGHSDGDVLPGPSQESEPIEISSTDVSIDSSTALEFIDRTISKITKKVRRKKIDIL